MDLHRQGGSKEQIAETGEAGEAGEAERERKAAGVAVAGKAEPMNNA